MFGKSSSVDDKDVAETYNRMMNQVTYKSMPFNTILHQFNSQNIESASSEANKKKTSWKNRNFLKVKINDLGGKIYNENEVPPAIKYLTSQEIRLKNIESAYDPIKYAGNQFTMPTKYRRRPQKDAHHSITISDKNYSDNKALIDYNRAVSKRTRILKNNSNKYFARYEYDKRLKRIENYRNKSIENGYKNKLSFGREKELKRGYDILSLKSHFAEPKRERKLNYVHENYPENERISVDGFKPALMPNVWDKINMTEDKRTDVKKSIFNDLKTSYSKHKNNRLVSKRNSHMIIHTSGSTKSNLEQSKRYTRKDRDEKRALRKALEIEPVNSYGDHALSNTKKLVRNPMSRSLNTITVVKNT